MSKKSNLNLSNLRKGDVIAVVDHISDDGKQSPAIYAGKPLIVRAISLPFVYTEDTYHEVLDTRKYTVMRVTRNALK